MPGYWTDLFGLDPLPSYLGSTPDQVFTPPLQLLIMSDTLDDVASDASLLSDGPPDVSDWSDDDDDDDSEGSSGKSSRQASLGDYFRRA